MKKSFPTIFICMLLLIYSILKVMFNITSISNYNFIINPLVYLGILVIATFMFDGVTQNIRDKKSKQKTVFILTFIYLIVFFALGLIFTFEYNALSLKFVNIIKNISSFILVIIIIELIRMLILGNVPKKRIYYIFIVICFTISELNINLESLSSFSNVFKFILGTLFPVLVKQSVYTYVSLKYGFVATIINRGLIQLAFVLSPILPKLEWFILTIIDVIYYYVVFIIVRFEEKIMLRNESKRGSKKSSPLVTVIFVLLILVTLLFQAGVFKYTPIAVMSDSMKPTFSRGDAVVVKKATAVDIANLEVGDIIEYVYDGRIVIHRVHKIYDINGRRYITAKGDNNKDPDVKYVLEEQIIGIAKFTIFYIGYPTVLLNDLLNGNDEPDIEMGK